MKHPRLHTAETLNPTYYNIIRVLSQISPVPVHLTILGGLRNPHMNLGGCFTTTCSSASGSSAMPCKSYLRRPLGIVVRCSDNRKENENYRNCIGFRVEGRILTHCSPKLELNDIPEESCIYVYIYMHQIP